MGPSLLWFCLGVVAVSASASAERSQLPACPEYCDCGRGTDADLEVTCPKGPRNSSFQLYYTPMRRLMIKCSADLSKKNDDLRMIQRMVLGPVQTFSIELCHIDFSLSEFLVNLSVSDVRKFYVKHSNLTNGIDRNMFKSFTNITTLQVSNSGINYLPKDLLQDLQNLTHLDLKENGFELPTELFQKVPKLIRLELGGNRIRHLSRDMFQNLTKLKLLNLWKNPFENVSSDVFQDLKSLESLDLQGSKLAQLSSNVFHRLEKLKFLYLNNNNLSALPEGLLAKTQQLQKFFVSGNVGLLLPPGLLSNLPNLTHIDLSGNKLSNLPADLLWGSSSMLTLDLRGNKLSDIPDDFFRDAGSLQTLDIRDNKFISLRNNIFSSLTKLQRLSITNNKLTSITEYTLQGLEKLEQLLLDHNQLTTIDYYAFRGFHQLKTINLSHNKLSFKSNSLGGSSPLSHCFSLEKLLLGNNSIEEIFEDWRLLMPKLTQLDLRFNNITRIQENDLQFLAKNLELDLRYNKIFSISLGNLDMFVEAQPPRANAMYSNPLKVFIDYNPLRCDCEIYHLLRYMERKLLPQVYNYIVLHSDKLKCSTPAKVANVSISQLNSQKLQCRLSEDEMKGEKCPALCSCWGRPYDRALIINCSSSGLETAPESLPQFSSYLNQTEVHLDKNKLLSLPNASQPGYSNVTKLYASYNMISKLEYSNIPSKLEVLEIDFNKLSYVDASTLFRLANKTNLRAINVANNPWLCDCEARDFVNFLQSYYKKVEHLTNMTCTDGRKLAELSADDLCALPVALIVSSSLSIAVLGIIIGTLAALYYRYQREVKVWLFAHNLCLSIVTEQELDKDKLYDAFVSYSHQDEDFVVNNLVPGLESGPTPFKLCLHFRDWMAGEWIPNQIARSVEDSRRTMVILSPNFLESVWGRMEFRAAHKQALSEGRARVIIVLYGDVGPIEGLDPELKAYLSMNTYVKWGDPWFWDKLRYALPHSPQKMKRTGLATIPPELRVKTTFDDKLELEPTTPSATTPPATILFNPLIHANGHIISLTNGHAKLITENGHLNGYVKSV